MKKFVHKNIYTIIIFLIFIGFSFFNTLPIGWKYNNDDLRDTLSAQTVSKYWEYTFKEELNEKIGTLGFIMPWFLINKSWLNFTNGFFWSPLILWSVFTIINNDFIFSVFQVLLIFGVIFTLYMILNKISSKSLNKKTFLMLLLTAPLLYVNLNIFYPDLLSSFLFLLWLYYFFNFAETNSVKTLLLMVVLFSFSLVVKLNYIIFLIPIFIYCFYRLVKLQTIIKIWFITLLIFLFIYFPQLRFNKITMWSYTEFSYTSYKNTYDGKVTATSSENQNEILSKQKNLLIYRIWNEYIIPQGTLYWNIIILLPVLFLCSLFFLFIFIGINKIDRRNKNIILIMFLLWFLFFWNMWWWFGIWQVNLRASLIRYLLPLIILLFGISVGWFLWANLNKSLKIIILSLILISWFWVLTTKYPFNAYTFWSFKRDFESAKTQLIKLVQSWSIILSAGFDDWFLTQLDKNYKIFDYWYIPKDFQEKEIFKVVEFWIKNNIPLYIYYINTASSSRWSNHLYDFNNKYEIQKIYFFGKYYYIYKIIWLKWLK